MVKVMFEKVYSGPKKKGRVHTQALVMKLMYIIRTMVIWIPRVITMVLAHSNEIDNGYLITSKNTNDITKEFS